MKIWFPVWSVLSSSIDKITVIQLIAHTAKDIIKRPIQNYVHFLMNLLFIGMYLGTIILFFNFCEILKKILANLKNKMISICRN